MQKGTMMNRNAKHQTFELIPILIYILFYGLISGAFLTRFPFVHSDEAWLAGLSRDMQTAGGFGVTESFFDLKPRVPHAVRILFHALQTVFIRLFGYEISSVRLLSLAAGLACLLILYYIGKRLGGAWIGAGLMILVSLDMSFIYASHFARQEILLGISLLSCLFLLLKCQGLPSPRQSLCLAALTGISVGIHPNSFLCAAVCGSVMLCSCPRPHNRPLILYTCATGIFAALFIGISFLYDPRFIPNYFLYGEQEFELSRSASGRIAQFLYYFKSIFRQESGTYYIPDLRLELILIPIFLILLLLAWLFLKSSLDEDVVSWCSHTRVLLSAMAGLAAGMVVIGRYNQTSIVFFILLGWILVMQLLLLFGPAGRLLFIAAAMAGLLWNGSLQLTPYINMPAYDSYLEQLSRLVPRDAGVIANLNTEFYFDQGVLRDYRNLPYMASRRELENYLEINKIQYICFTDELDYIYENRPNYNVIYGNASFIKDLQSYCESDCTLVGTFENPMYGPRIISLLGTKEYASIRVYRVEEP